MSQRLVMAGVFASLIFISITHADVVRTVALTGQAVPGAPAGVVFDSFGTYVHPDQFLYGGAVLNEAGQVAFRANLAGDGVDFTNYQGVWSEGSGSLALVARSGSQAPGAAAGVNFSTDPGVELFFPVLNDAGQTAFYGATTDGNRGLWSEGSGSLAAVARTGDPAPGTPNGVTFTFDLHEYLESPIMNNAGQTTFRSNVSGPGVNDSNKLGLWSEGSGSLQLVARLGSQASGLPAGVNHGYFYEAGLNDAGQAVFFSTLSGTGVGGTNDHSVWLADSAGATLVAREGAPVPGLPGLEFADLAYLGSINNAGQIALVAGLGDNNAPIGQAGVWLVDSSNFTLLARGGDHAPGMPNGVRYEALYTWPALNDAGQTLFGAVLAGSGVNESNNSALFLSDALGNVTKVARRGDQAAGTPPGTFLSNSPDAIGALVLNNAGQVALINGLTGAEVNFTNDRGIWATDRSGAQQLIAREGDALEVAPGDFRTISELSFFGDTGNANGWPSAFNNRGQLAFWASFTDGSQGVFVSDAVAHQPGDFNNDGVVDGADLAQWKGDFGLNGNSDADYDGDTDGADFLVWQRQLGGSLSTIDSSAVVPEPTAFSLLLLALTGSAIRLCRLDQRFVAAQVVRQRWPNACYSSSQLPSCAGFAQEIRNPKSEFRSTK